MRWQAPSLAGLAERLANHDEVHFVARTLVDAEAFNEDCLHQLVTWMQTGKKLHVHLSVSARSRLDDALAGEPSLQELQCRSEVS